MNYPTEYVKKHIKNDYNKFPQLLEGILGHLNIGRYNNYNKWVSIGLISYKFGNLGIDLWKRFSKQYRNCSDIELNDMVKLFSLNSGLTFCDLIDWLRDDDREYYLDIRYNFKDIINSFYGISNSCISSKFYLDIDAVDFYYSLKRDTVKHSNKKWYMWCPIYQYWKETSDTYLRQCVAKTFDHIATDVINISNRERQIHDIDNLCKLRKKVTKDRYIKRIYLEGKFNDNHFSDKLNSCPYTINFKNGIVDLRTGAFRIRTVNDKVSEYLPFNYSSQSNDNIKDKVMKVVSAMSNDDSELIQFNLSWFGYCLTGQNYMQKFLVINDNMISHTKPTLVKVFADCFPTYCSKLDSKTFLSSEARYHKQMTNLKKPIRLAYIEEIEQKGFDVQNMKDFVDGDKFVYIGGCRGNIENVKSQCKLVIVNSKKLEFKENPSIQRRGLLYTLTDQYIDDQELLNTFDDDVCKVELFNILLPYTMSYLNNNEMFIPSILNKNFTNNNFVKWKKR